MAECIMIIQTPQYRPDGSPFFNEDQLAQRQGLVPLETTKDGKLPLVSMAEYRRRFPDRSHGT